MNLAALALVTLSLGWSTPSQAPDLSATGCGGAMAYVWQPSRLQVLAPCFTVSGTVHYASLAPTMSSALEPDGDLHIWLTLDRAYAGLYRPNPFNGAPYGPGTFRVVVPCDMPVSATACGSFRNHVPVPAVGSWIVATGVLVLDLPHSERRLQPVVRLQVYP